MLCVHCVPAGQSACVAHITRSLGALHVAAQPMPTYGVGFVGSIFAQQMSPEQSSGPLQPIESQFEGQLPAAPHWSPGPIGLKQQTLPAEHG